MTKIYTPNKRYTGLTAGVSFVNGVGQTDNQYLIGWFEEKGYIIEKADEDNLIEDVNKAHELAIKENIKKLTVKELKDLAKEKEVEGYSNMNKEELIKILVGD